MQIQGSNELDVPGRSWLQAARDLATKESMGYALGQSVARSGAKFKEQVRRPSIRGSFARPDDTAFERSYDCR